MSTLPDHLSHVTSTAFAQARLRSSDPQISLETMSCSRGKPLRQLAPLHIYNLCFDIMLLPEASKPSI